MNREPGEAIYLNRNVEIANEISEYLAEKYGLTSEEAFEHMRYMSPEELQHLYDNYIVVKRDSTGT